MTSLTRILNALPRRQAGRYKILATVTLVGLLLLLLSLWIVQSPWVLGLAPEEKQPPSTQTRTVKFFIFQEPAVLVSPNSTTTSFTVFIGDKTPVVKSAYIEIRGVTQAAASQTITADINQTDSFPTSRQQAFTLDSTGQPGHFRLLYNGSASQTLTSYLAGIITDTGSYSFYLKVDISGADVSLLQARMVITYQFTPLTEAGGFPATGTLISPIFDTGAVNGATFNTIRLTGNTPSGTKIRVQLATSNSSSGPFTYLGPDCTENTYYWDAALISATESKEIGCFPNHHNKRYFRYKVILHSNPPSFNLTPQIDDVTVNWSP